MSFLLLLAAIAPLSQADFDAARERAPKDVRAVLQRWEGCNHWSGEEPYDRQRARQIDRALKTLRCDGLSGDVADLQQRYKGQAQFLRLLAKAHALFD